MHRRPVSWPLVAIELSADPDGALPRFRAGLPANTGLGAPHFGHPFALACCAVPHDSQARVGPFRFAFFLAVAIFR